MYVTCYNCGVIISLRTGAAHYVQSHNRSTPTTTPLQVTAAGISELRALEIEVVERIRSDRGGELPVRIVSRENEVMAGYVFTASVPGQTRSVTVGKNDLSLSHVALVEKLVDELKYAIYLLLDEDAEEE